MAEKTYLGDSVYADYDGNGITLTTEDGISASNTIYIEPEVYFALANFVSSLNESEKEASDG